MSKELDAWIPAKRGRLDYEAEGVVRYELSSEDLERLTEIQKKVRETCAPPSKDEPPTHAMRKGLRPGDAVRVTASSTHYTKEDIRIFLIDDESAAPWFSSTSGQEELGYSRIAIGLKVVEKIELETLVKL